MTDWWVIAAVGGGHGVVIDTLEGVSDTGAGVLNTGVGVSNIRTIHND